MCKTIAVHSYKGGTGKTVLAVNLAVIYAKKGNKVCLLDFDFRAPSLHTLFQPKTKCWTNNVLMGDCSISDAIFEYNLGDSSIFVGLSDPDVDAIRNITSMGRRWQVKVLQQMMSLRSALEEKGMDIIVFDTNPGIEFMSINTIVAADYVLIVLKPDKYGIEGTEQLIRGIYGLLKKDAGIVQNKCFDEKPGIQKIQDIPVIGSIPCSCDISKYGDCEILAITKPTHDFIKAIEDIADKIYKKIS